MNLIHNRLFITIFTAGLILASTERCTAQSEHQETDSDFLRKLFTGYEAMQGLVIDLEATVVEQGKETAARFRVTYGFPKSEGMPPPFSIEEMVDNPGEPHLSDPQIAKEWLAQEDGVWGHFTRHFVTEPPVSRNSYLVLSPANSVYLPVFDFVSRSLQINFDGAPADSTFGQVDSLVKGVPFEKLGTVTFDSIDCQKVRLTFSDNTANSWKGTYLVVMEPSFQIVKIVEVTSENPVVAKSLLDRFADRTVHEIDVQFGIAIPTHVTFNGRWLKGEMRVSSIEKLPRDHHGLWEFDGPTGTDFAGPLELSMRKASDGKEAVNQYYSRLPYTEKEEQLIRAYARNSTKQAPGQPSSARTVFWSLSAIAIIGYIAWAMRSQKNRLA